MLSCLIRNAFLGREDSLYVQLLTVKTAGNLFFCLQQNLAVMRIQDVFFTQIF